MPATALAEPIARIEIAVEVTAEAVEALDLADVAVVVEEERPHDPAVRGAVRIVKRRAHGDVDVAVAVEVAERPDVAAELVTGHGKGTDAGREPLAAMYAPVRLQEQDPHSAFVLADLAVTAGSADDGVRRAVAVQIADAFDRVAEEVSRQELAVEVARVVADLLVVDHLADDRRGTARARAEQRARQRQRERRPTATRSHCLPATFAHVSLSVAVRLNTGRPGRESGSTAK